MEKNVKTTLHSFATHVQCNDTYYINNRFMNKSNSTQGNAAVIGVLAVGVLALGVALALGRSSDTDAAPEQESPASADGMAVETMNTDKENDSDSTTDEGAPVRVAGSYEAYNPEAVARAATGEVVLFFSASWCPSCRAADKAIEQGDLPAGVTILKVDYDSATELKKKYGVTTQHSFVQVDAGGNEVAQWAGTTKLQDILAKII